MSELLGSIWWLLVALGLLVTFHEFGHFWVARKLGVRVLRFSVGFGKALWSRRGADGTEYVIAAIPLGGYVKMLDEREGVVEDQDLDQAFNRKPVWSRIAIVAAGPAFNLVFAILAFWLMFLVGIPESRPVIGEVSGLAAAAGIEPGDRIIAINDEDTHTWSHAILGLITYAMDREPVRVTVENRQGDQYQRTLNMNTLGDDFNEEKLLDELGLSIWRATLPPVIGEVAPGTPAEGAGLLAGDRILQVGGKDIPSWGWIGHHIQEQGRDGRSLDLTVFRDGSELQISILPIKEKSGWFSNRLLIGITPEPISPQLQADIDRAYVLLRFGPLEGFNAAVGETWRLTSSTLSVLGRMITGKASVKNLSGPVSIARFANSSANAGLSSFLFFLGAISLSLAIINLLPIPVLDGGHLMYYLVELLKGSPVSQYVQEIGQRIGLVALAGLMSVAIINDILRLVG
jgi:regulator of sigma E protease